MGFSFCKSCSGLCNPWENLWFGAIIWNNCSKVLKACYSAQLLPFFLYPSLNAIGAVRHQFGLLGVISILYLVQVLSRFSTRASSSCSSSARTSMSSTNRRLVIFLPTMLIFPSCSSKALDIDLFEKRVEEGRRQKTALPYSDKCSEPFSYPVIHQDCTCSLVIELLNVPN